MERWSSHKKCMFIEERALMAVEYLRDTIVGVLEAKDCAIGFAISRWIGGEVQTRTDSPCPHPLPDQTGPVRDDTCGRGQVLDGGTDGSLSPAPDDSHLPPWPQPCHVGCKWGVGGCELLCRASYLRVKQAAEDSTSELNIAGG